MENTTYLKHVRLSGYKTIWDAEIEFHPGLNIIIGYNGVGKTNFMEFLHNSLRPEKKLPPDGSGSITIKSKTNEVSYSFKPIQTKKNSLGLVGPLGHNFNMNNNEFYSLMNLSNELFKDNLFFDCELIKHGIPKHIPIIKHEAKSSWIVNSEGEPEIRAVDSSEYNQFEFTRLEFSILIRLAFTNENIINKKNNEIKKLVSKILNNFASLLKNHLDKNGLGLIDDVIFEADKVRITKRTDLRELHFTIPPFLYSVNGMELAFEELSDGTRRMIYIFSELLGYYYDENNNNEPTPRIFFLEEPELSIHPHLLHKLLLKIREESERSQVILTTHSPQVLDILDIDELDRIIIADFDPQKGTFLRHLTEEEQTRARNHMENKGFLSEYWAYTDALQNSTEKNILT